MTIVLGEGDVPQPSTYLIIQAHDGAVLAAQSAELCARSIQNSERNIALLGDNKVPFAPPLQLPLHVYNTKYAARSGTSTLSNEDDCRPLFIVQNTPPPNTPADSPVLRQCYLSQQAVTNTMNWKSNHLTHISRKTMTIKDGAESGTAKGIHESTRKITHIHGQATESVSTVRAKRRYGDTLIFFSATSGPSVYQRRISATGYIKDLVLLFTCMPEMLDMIITLVMNLQTQREEERER